jgi:hypothetical protein
MHRRLRPRRAGRARSGRALLDTLQARFEFLSRTPNTPSRFVDGATGPDGDIKRMMLDRNNYYATTAATAAAAVAAR